MHPEREKDRPPTDPDGMGYRPDHFMTTGVDIDFPAFRDRTQQVGRLDVTTLNRKAGDGTVTATTVTGAPILIPERRIANVRQSGAVLRAVCAGLAFLGVALLLWWGWVAGVVP